MSPRLALHSSCAVAALAFSSFSAPVLAQDTADEASANDDQPVIIVTGTRRTDRTVADSTVPIDVIGAEALLNQGSTETNRLLNNLVPSFNFPQPSLTDGTDSLRPATLRGLAPDQVLVLVNGKRRHISSLLNLNGSVGRGSAGVDMNTIPPLAIERIEVLRDGAASQYGSDAIAGVINIQLKKREGGRAQASYGKYITTMEDVFEIESVEQNATGANPIVTFSDEERKRRDGETWTFATNIGLPVGDSGYLNWTAEYKDRSPSNRSGPDVRRQYISATDPRELTINRFNHRFGDGESKDLNFFLNAGMDVGASFELYSFGSYGIRDGNGAGFYRRSRDDRNRDFAASTTTFVPYYPDGFLPLINSEIEDIAGALGIRGETAGWNLDLSVNYGSNRLDYSISNSWNASLGGLVSPRKFNAGGLRSGQTSVNFDAQRPIDLGIGESSLAIGGEWRNENYKIVAGDEASYINGPFFASNGAPGGAQVFPGFAPNSEVDRSRNSYAAYVELDTDLSDMFNVQIAGRYEHFSDFGDTLNGKIAARFEPIDGLAVRGSASTGFRAPGMAQQFFSTISTNNITGVGLVEVGTFRVDSEAAIALGAQPLEPEESLNLSGGLVFSMVPGLNITVDYYNIKIDDRIILTENLGGADVVAILQAAGISAGRARFFINGIDTRTEGVDIVGSYRVPDFGIGRITLTAGYNINDTTITDRRTFSGFTADRLFARPESYRLTDGQPSNKLNIGIDWDNDPFGATLRANRYGSIFLPDGAVNSLTVAKGAAANDFTLSPKWVVDLELRFKPFDAVQLAFGANNLLDEYPDRLPPTGNNIFLPYSSQSPFGFSGRFVYGRVSIDF